MRPLKPLTLVLFGLLIFVVYLASAWFFLPVDAVWSPDEGAKLLQLSSLRFENGRLTFDIAYLGVTIDPGMVFALSNPHKDVLRVADGRLMLERLPLFSLLTLPFYRWLGFYGLYLLPAFCGALISVLALLLLREGQRRFSMLLLIAFGSPVWIYACIFWEHTLASSLALAGALLLLRFCMRSPVPPLPKFLYLVAAMILFSLAVYLRLEVLLFVIALLVACWLVVKDQRGWVLLGVLVLVLCLLPYQPLHRTLFSGQSLPMNARYLNLPLAYLKSAQWRAIPDLLVGPAQDEGVYSGWLGGLWSLAAVVAVAHSFAEADSGRARFLRRAGLIVSAGVAAFFLLAPSDYRAAHGLLFSTPWAVLGLTRIPEAWRDNDWRIKTLILTCILGLGAYTLVMVGLRGSSPHGGLEWGARFALTFYPLLALVAAWGWRGKPAADRVIIGVLLVLGLGFQARGLVTIRQDKQVHAVLNQTISQMPEEHVVTDLWWLLVNSAPTHPSKALYAAGTPAEVVDWVHLATGQGVGSFVLVTLDHSLAIYMAAELQPQELVILDLIQVDNLLVYRLGFR